VSDESTKGQFELVGHRYLRIAHFLNLGVVKLVMDDDGREMIAVQITIAAGDEIEDVVIPIEDAGELCKQLLFQVAPHGPPFAKELADYARENWPRRKDAA
jgi:hypothetical protein